MYFSQFYGLAGHGTLTQFSGSLWFMTSRLKYGFIYTSDYWLDVSWSNRGDLVSSIMQQASLGMLT